MALFGPPPVDLHGPLHRFGIMDPLCGGIRAARYTARGEWALAWQYNPLGVVAVLGAAAGAVRAAVGALSGRWLTARFHWTPWRRRVILAVVVALLLGLEVRQQFAGRSTDPGHLDVPITHRGRSHPGRWQSRTLVHCTPARLRSNSSSSISPAA